jgi:hypothetical protein
MNPEYCRKICKKCLGDLDIDGGIMGWIRIVQGSMQLHAVAKVIRKLGIP